MSVLLQTSAGDLDLTGGRATLVTDPIAAGCQTLRNKFLLFKGEWYLDARVGWPFIQLVAIKNPNRNVVSNLIKRVIIGTAPFVSAQVTLTLNAGTRSANASFIAYVDPTIVPGGVTVTAASLDAPYIIINLPSQGGP